MGAKVIKFPIKNIIDSKRALLVSDFAVRISKLNEADIDALIEENSYIEDSAPEMKEKVYTSLDELLAESEEKPEGDLFEVGGVYFYNFACSYDTWVRCEVIKRTKHFIVIAESGREKTKRLKVRTDSSGNERVSLGNYSMAPILTATDKRKRS